MRMSDVIKGETRSAWTIRLMIYIAGIVSLSLTVELITLWVVK